MAFHFSQTKSSSPGRALTVLINPASITSGSPTPITFLLPYSASATLTFLLFLEQSRYAPAFGSQSVSLLPTTLFLEVSIWTKPLPPSSICSNVTFSRRPDYLFKATSASFPNIPCRSNLLQSMFHCSLQHLSLSNKLYNDLFIMFIVYCLFSLLAYKLQGSNVLCSVC